MKTHLISLILVGGLTVVTFTNAQAPVGNDIIVNTNEDTTLTITLTATDPDDDSLSFLIINTASNGVLSGISSVNDTAASIIYDPFQDYNGSDSFTFSVTDSSGLSDTAAVSITVTPVNDVPVLTSIADQSIAEGDTFTTVTLDDYISDIETSAADISWAATGQTDLVVVIDTGRVVTISTPGVNWNGTETVVFTATDNGDNTSAALSVADTVIFTVTPVNDVPVLT